MAERIFRRIIDVYMKEKTIIYSTLQNTLIQRADKILYLQSGEILQQGTYIELLSEYKKEFFRMMIGKRKKNWRRQVLGKLFEGLKGKNQAPSQINNL